MPPEDALNVDFAALAIADAEFAKIYTANDGRIDFQDPEQVQQLTKSVLRRDFGLKIELPGDRLCPPVPVRYQYIRWLQSLVDSTSDTYVDSYDDTRPVIGIDIGVGASCIYPLLGCAVRANWRFGGTDVDETSLGHAQKQVVLNDMQSRIRLKKAVSQGPILDLKALGIEHADFIMCNPPFFTSKQDMLATHLTKKVSPSAVCTGADVEMITEGGDLGFVSKIVDESTKLRGQVQWYSSMLGKLSSAQAVVQKLKQTGASNWAVTSLQAGHVTKRWAVAWSFDNLRPSNDVARGDLSNKDILPFPTEFQILIPTTSSAGDVAFLIDGTMSSMDQGWKWDGSALSGLFFTRTNTWARSARRKRQRARKEPSDQQQIELRDPEGPNEDAALGARIFIPASNKVVVRWLRGTDVVLFESFCGMLKRTIKSPEDG